MHAWASAAITALLLPVLPAACGPAQNGTAASSPRTLVLLPGTQRHLIGWGGYRRTYLLHLPGSLPAGSHPPLVIVLHGATLTADQTERYYRWDPLADAEGFAVAYPQGLNDAWNAGSCCGDAPERGTDDVGFIGAVIADATERSDADQSRRFLTGVSNGAMMTLRYQCERSSQLAAIGSVAGTLTTPCDPPPPVPFIAIHGLDDQVVTFAESSSTANTGRNVRLPAMETIRRYLAADRCHSPVTRSAGPVHTQTATCPPGLDIEVVTIDGAGHQWPGAKLDAGRLAKDGPHDQPSDALNATATLWSFFAAHRLDRGDR